MEIDPLILEAYTRTFIPRFDRYPIQKPDGTYGAVKSPLMTRHIEEHFRGERTIGAYALSPQDYAHWICFDADDEEKWNKVLDLADDVERHEGLIPRREVSRRGGHLWLFTPTISGIDARRFGKQLLSEYHIEKVELYPKSASEKPNYADVAVG